MAERLHNQEGDLEIPELEAIKEKLKKIGELATAEGLDIQ